MKKPLQILVFFLLPVISYSTATAQTFSWAHNFGGTDNDAGSHIAADGMGNSYVTGFFNGTATFGSITLTSNGGEDAYLAKYDASGNAAWVKQAGGTLNDEGTAVFADASGDIYWGGFYASPSITFGLATFTNSGGEDMFFAKYDALGTLMSAAKAGGSGYERPLAICGSASQMFATGYIAGIGSACTFGTITITGTGVSSMFLVKYDISMMPQWAQKAGGIGATGNVRGTGIGEDSFGNPYVCGKFLGGADFVTQQLSAIGNTDMFLAKYNNAGILSSAYQYYGVAGAQIQPASMQTDASGFCYIAGYFLNSITLGSNTLTSNGMADIFITKINAVGNVQWAKSAGGPGDDKATGIAFDAGGNAYLSGNFDGNFNFGSIPVTGISGTPDVFVAKFSGASTSWEWVRTGGTTGFEYGNDIAYAGGTDLFITGQSDSPFMLGSSSIANDGLNDGFIAKLSTLTGIDVVNANPDFFVYPNPATANIVIDLDNQKFSTGEIQLINTTGEVVYRQYFCNKPGKKLNLNFNKNIDNGLYILKFISDSSVLQHQLLISK